MDKKCNQCSYCEPDGIGISREPECRKLKEECCTATQYCDGPHKKK